MADHQQAQNPDGATMAAQLATLSEINQAINASLDLDVVIHAVMDQVIEVVKAQRGFLMLRDDQTGAMQMMVARGMDREDLATPEFQYSTTIVEQVVRTGEPLLTSNAEHDPRLKTGQSIIALGLRSCLCVPLRVKNRLIGLVYVDNSLRAGVFRQSDLDLLTAFAAMAGIALDNARLHRLEVQAARLERELSMAREIQLSMLPRQLPALPGYEIAAHWQSAREVAGDFYDVFDLGHDQLGVVVADVADKGIAAALFMAVARSLIRGNAIATRFPLDTIHQANRLMLMESADSGMFVTVYYTVLEQDGRATGVNAGHNRPLFYHAAADRVEWLPRGGWAMGWFDDMPLTPCEIVFQPGDVLVAYTDGLTEAENAAGQCFGQDRLAEAVREQARRGGAAADILQALGRAVNEFIGDVPPFDDMTMVVVRYTGAK
ncbi:MAG: SpoIIE family protein phosphatase [Anaerolineae bacterium]|nr:SpoIIE family protein phosphatase [Anaerolineae bacterium]